MDFRLLNRLISESKLGKAQIAKQANISRTTLDNAISGADIKVSTIEILANVLGVSPKIFFEDLHAADSVVKTSGDFSPASFSGDVTVGAADAMLSERVRHLEELLAEKERLIKVLLETRVNGWKPDQP